MSDESKYDPIKLVNKNIYFNSMMLRQRYEMMSVIDYSIKKGVGYPDNNIYKMMANAKLHDEGLINSHFGLNNIGLEDLTTKSLSFKDKIDSMMEKLDLINHTELHNNSKAKEIIKPNNIIHLRSTRLHKFNKFNDEVLFPRIEFKIPKKKVITEPKQIDKNKIKRQTMKDNAILNRSNRKILTILGKSEPEKPSPTINYMDSSTMLATEINQHNERDEYYHMIVDNEVQLYKKYLIPPGHTIQQPETIRERIYESTKNKGLQSLFDKKEIDEYINQVTVKKNSTKVRFSNNILKSLINGKSRSSRNARKIKFNINDNTTANHRSIERTTSVDKGIEMRKVFIDRKLKPLKIYVTENLKRLNQLNDEYKNSFKKFDNYFEGITYDKELDD
jgi:hypothetical protein